MKVTRLTSKRLLLEFTTRKEMTLSNFRISEYSEGLDGIKDTYFTPDQFIDRYSDENGDIDYFSYWEGFNYSKLTLRKFINTFYGLLSQREINIIGATYDLPDDGYIISAVEGDLTTIKHELAHGYYFESPLYKEKVDAILTKIPESVLNELKKGLLAINYIDEVLMDEIQAYLTAFDIEECHELFPDTDIRLLTPIIDELNANYNEFAVLPITN